MPEWMHEPREADLAHRLEVAERDAARSRTELERLRSRRGVRVALLLGSLPRHPGRLLRLPRLLMAALRRPEPPPEVPERGSEPPPAPSPQPPARTIPDEAVPNPHLDVAHPPGTCSFHGLAHCVAAKPETWRGRYDGGADLLVLEPARSLVPSEDEEARALLGACEADGVPSVLVARTDGDLAAPWAADVDLVVTDDAGVAERVRDRGCARTLVVEPWIDAATFNPVGWEREAQGGVLCLVEPAGDPGRSRLAPLLADPPPELTVRRLEPVEQGDPEALAADLRGRRAVLALPELHPDEPAYLRHVLAAAACGTPVVTTPSGRLDRLLPPDGVRVVRTVDEARGAFDALSDSDARERASVRSRRHVHTHHVARNRFDEVLEALGIPVAPPERISVLLSTHREDLLDRAIGNVARQRYPHKELVVVLHGCGSEAVTRARALTADLAFPASVIPAPAEWTFGDCLNAGLRASTGDLVAKMDDDDLYGAEHLNDLIAARRYAPADVIGKWAQFVYLEARDVTIARQTARQERHGTHLPGPTFLVPRDLLRRFGFSRVDSAIDTALWRRLSASGARLYSTHRYNFVRVRHGSHTFQRSEEEFLASADAVLDGLHREVLDV